MSERCQGERAPGAGGSEVSEKTRATAPAAARGREGSEPAASEILAPSIRGASAASSSPPKAGGARAFELPIHPSSQARPSGRDAIRKSRVGPWRAAVLIVVHVLIALHFVHWWQTDRTLTPLEPSESMQFSTTGIVNAGFILFSLAILSTALLGRWFCGWACHVVALQDASRWLLGKIGLVPRLVDLGPLRAVPWLAFVYMFLAPIFDRLLAGQSLGIAGAQFTTDDLWRTFPRTWFEALATFAVCGFVIVWLLGSKGFCTYGCPYGGIFGVADQLAPTRIRVTDACEGCGHCTAVCTSNVNVSREVREFGMVVDPGCMKCLDCVSVCPNDALYVGLGKPALFATKKDTASKPTAKPAFDWARLALSAPFTFAALAVFLWHDGFANLRFTAITWAFAFAVLLVFRGKARPKPDHTFVEEVAMAVLFVAAMVCFRGLRESVPFLFALGIASLVAWWGVEWARMLWKSDVRVQRSPLKRAGRWTIAGGAFAATALPVGWLAVAGFREQSAERLAKAAYQAESHARAENAVAEFNRGVEAAQNGRIPDAIAAFRRTLDLDATFLAARENLAGALCMSGDLAGGLAQFEIAIEQNPSDPGTLALSAQALAGLGRMPEARGRLERALAIAPERSDLWRMLGDLQASSGDAKGAATSRARAESIERAAH